jgi:flagellar hook protein FlgE
MGIFGALTTSVAGLRANSYALENISGNIANSQTTAFKRIDSSFLDLIPQTGNTQQLAGSVTFASRSTNTVQGSVTAASVSTFMAINGEGFFVVQKPGSFADNNPVFDGVNRYTRRGDFSLDKNGYLVNGAGYYVEGVPIDTLTGNKVGDVPQVLKFKNDQLPSQATSSIEYRANLASYPLTTNHVTSTPGSELLDQSDFIPNPSIFTDASVSGAAVTSQVPAAITGASLLGGGAGSDSIGLAVNDTITVNGITITVRASGTATGNDVNIDDTVTELLAKIDAISGNNTATPSKVTASALEMHTGTLQDFSMTGSLGVLAKLGFVATPVTANRTPTAHANQVVLGVDNQNFLDETISGGAATAYDGAGAPVDLQFRWAKIDSSTLGGNHKDVWNMFYQVTPNATNSQIAWQNVGENFTFGTDGQMTSPAAGKFTLPSVIVNGKSLGNLTLAIGSGGLTQFADTNGNVQVNQLQQNGFPAGTLKSVSVSNDGRVVGSYSNGRNIDLAEISVATFNGANFLKRTDGGVFEATNESGAALYGKGGTISGSSLESSNTDIADEFTKLIVTQQAYSANTKVITTANTMVQDLLNVMR